MGRLAAVGSVIVLSALVAGCGLGQNGARRRGVGGPAGGTDLDADTGNPPASVDSTTPMPRTLTDARATVAYGPDGEDGRPTLQVVVDGLVAVPLEVAEPAELRRAGARPGQTLTVSGLVDPSPVGTRTTHALRVTEAALDDVATTVRRDPAGGLVDGEGCRFEPTGPLLPALEQALASGRPVRITGRLEETPSSLGAAVEALLVTSARPTTTVTLELRGRRRPGGRELETIAIDDLDGTGAYRVEHEPARRPQRRGRRAAGAASGRGFVDARIRDALRGLVARPEVTGFVAAVDAAARLPRGPLATLSLDGQAATIAAAKLEAGTPVAELVSVLETLGDTAPVVRSLLRATETRVEAASATVVRSREEQDALWQLHAGRARGGPRVDYETSRLLAVFLGPPTPLEAEVEVVDVERVGSILSVIVERRSASTRRPMVAHFVALDRATPAHGIERTLAFGVLPPR